MDEPGTWTTRFPRTSQDLVTQFMGRPDRVTVRSLVRHVLLNKADEPLPDDEIGFLEKLVHARGRLLHDMMENYRQARSEEMLVLAESDAVEPVDLPELDEDEIRQVAGKIRRAAEPGSRFGTMSMEDLIAYVRADPPVGAMLPSGLSYFTTAGGGVYLFKQFPDLPRSDRMFEDLKFFSGQFLAGVCAWFESRGYASSHEMSEVIDGIAGFSPRTLRQVPAVPRRRGP